MVTMLITLSPEPIAQGVELVSVLGLAGLLLAVLMLTARC
jgi:hypothetical protein